MNDKDIDIYSLKFEKSETHFLSSYKQKYNAAIIVSKLFHLHTYCTCSNLRRRKVQNITQQAPSQCFSRLLGPTFLGYFSVFEPVFPVFQGPSRVPVYRFFQVPSRVPGLCFSIFLRSHYSPTIGLGHGFSVFVGPHQGHS